MWDVVTYVVHTIIEDDYLCNYDNDNDNEISYI